MIYETIKKIAIGALMVGSILTSAPGELKAEPKTPSTKGRIELVAGKEKATIDSKLVIPIASGVRAFNRNRVTPEYEGNTSFFSHLDVGYSAVKGNGYEIRPVVAADITSKGVVPRVGFDVSGKLGDFRGYLQASIAAQEDTNGFVLAKLSYDGNKNFGPVANIETANSFTDQNLSARQSGRAGISIKGLQLGVGVDSYQKGEKQDTVVGGWINFRSK